MLKEERGDLCSKLLALSECVAASASSDVVLNTLHDITNPELEVNVLGAIRLPRCDGISLNNGRSQSLFLHQSVSAGWSDQYQARAAGHPSPVFATLGSRLKPVTVSEAMRANDLVGEDRWMIDLFHEHGIRDALLCPVGHRWVFGYWSADVTTLRLTSHARWLLAMAAQFAVAEIAAFAASHEGSDGDPVVLTAREDAVLRSLARGNRVSATARELGIGDETVRTHIKKAQAKLGARTQTQAVAEALRRGILL